MVPNRSLGKFAIWKRVHVVHFERLVNINFRHERVRRRTMFHHFMGRNGSNYGIALWKAPKSYMVAFPTI